jgi:hypothetical protein
MKNIETLLTWGLGVLAIVLIVLSSLNTTSTDFNISNVNSDVNDGFNLNHDHQIQKASSFNVKDPNMGIAAMAEALGEFQEVSIIVKGDVDEDEDNIIMIADTNAFEVIFDDGEQKIIIIADEDNSDE